MDIKIKICDRCGKIVDTTDNYYMLKAIRNHQSDGEYELCKDCYTELSGVLRIYCGYKDNKEELKKFNNKSVMNRIKEYTSCDWKKDFGKFGIE